MQALGLVTFGLLLFFVFFMIYDVTTNPEGHGNIVVKEKIEYRE